MDNGGNTVVNPTSASKEQKHQRYKQKNGAWGDGWTWFATSANHPTKKPVAYEIPSAQLAALQKLTTSTSQTMSISCNGALLYRYQAQGSKTNVYSNAVSFSTGKEGAGKRWESPFTMGNADVYFNPYLVYTVSHDTCQSNTDSVLGRVDFNFVTKDVGGLPVVDFRVNDFGDGGEKMGAKWGPVTYVTRVRPGIGESPGTVAKSCRHILQANPLALDGQYFVSPAGKVVDLAICDMTCQDDESPCKMMHKHHPFGRESGEVIQPGGYTCLPPMRQVPFRNWWNGGDSYRLFSTQNNVRKGWSFKYKFDTANLGKLQTDSSQATQILIGHCRDSIAWTYGGTFGSGMGYAWRFTGWDNGAWRYNANPQLRPLVLNTEDECRWNGVRGPEDRDETVFRFMTSRTKSIPIKDYAPRDHGSSNEWTGLTLGNACFL
jgi:hypothetical protein